MAAGPKRRGVRHLADRVLSQGIGVGSEIKLEQGTSNLSDTFETRTFTVVGTVHMPYYVSSAAIDPSSLGSGVVQQVLYVAESTFADDYPYTDAFLTVEGAAGAQYGTAAYDELGRRREGAGRRPSLTSAARRGSIR